MFTPGFGKLQIPDDINIEDIKLSCDSRLDGLYESAADGMCVWLKNRWHLALFARHDGNWKRYYTEILDLQVSLMTFRPTVLIDCDGVLADFDTMVFDRVKSQYGISVEDTTMWDILDDPKLADLKDEIWDWMINTEGVIRGLGKYDYADSLIGELREFCHVICVTSAVFTGNFPSERVSWLMEELNFGRKDIMLCYQKERIIGDVLVDDKPANVEAWADAHHKNGGIPVLWQTPKRPHKSEDKRLLHTGDPAVLISTIKKRLGL